MRTEASWLTFISTRPNELCMLMKIDATSHRLIVVTCDSEYSTPIQWYGALKRAVFRHEPTYFALI
jgi:hypothetical protein